MRFVLPLLCAAVLSCSAPSGWSDANGVLRGELSSSVLGPLHGDAWVLLLEAETGVGLDTQALHATAIPDERLGQGDREYVLAGIQPGRYLLWTLIDSNENLELEVDVLAQPGRGDLISDPLEVTLVPGEHRVQDVAVARRLARDPPSFRPSPQTPTRVVLPDTLGAVVSITLEADGLGLLQSDGFHVRLVDANADGRPDDANGDGLPELEPQLFLRFRPGLGQSVPVDSEGVEAEVILPLAVNPSPFLTALAQDTSNVVVVPSLTGFVLPQAQAVWTRGEVRTSESLGAIPIGDYELIVLDPVAGYWKIPNELAARGGIFTSQGTRFRVEHGRGLDAGVFTQP